MGQVRLGGRPRHVELGSLGAHSLEGAARLLDPAVVLFERGAERLAVFLGRSHVLTETLELAKTGIQLGFGDGDCTTQLLAARLGPLQLVAPGEPGPDRACIREP